MFRYGDCYNSEHIGIALMSRRFPALSTGGKEPSGVEIPLRDKGNFIAESSLLYLPIRAGF
jgi:hypothetical protein